MSCSGFAVTEFTCPECGYDLPAHDPTCATLETNDGLPQEFADPNEPGTDGEI